MGQSAVRAPNNNTSQASAGSGGELEKASSTAGAAPDHDDAPPHRHQQRRRRCSRPEAEDYRHLPSCSHKPSPRVLFSQIMSESGKAESMMMSEPDDEIAWVFDSLIGFLHGPIWSAPLLTFIEDKSLIFEPETQDCQEYREVYQDYKNLVDLLLGCYMEDMEITPEQFERACTMNTSSRIGVQFQQSLFEQIWAANEFEIFKRMMIQKNLELQLQALRMIEQKYGLTPASLTNEETGKDDDMPIEELLRTDPTPTSNETEKEEMEDVVAPPPDLDIDKAEEAVRQEHERLAAEYRNESALLMEALKNTSDEPSSVESPLLEQETEFNGEQAQEESLESPDGDAPAATIAAASAAITAAIAPAAAAAASRIPTAEIINVKPAKEDVLSKIDLQKRQQYLKAQRDKLVALKKQARSHKLESAADISSHAAGGSSSRMTRPSSARVVAEAAIDGNQAELLAQQQQNIIDASVLQVRKALAARLKAEVVQK
ncbi:hypothetical protein TKK_0009820 [Trichogramma kaykai]|uniref:Cilia- and flagella-associated protein 36 n=1 Tax=Trichogramma kaykai TaxID=54128 RepID=A0ABD2X292_9HYME